MVEIEEIPPQNIFFWENVFYSFFIYLHCIMFYITNLELGTFEQEWFFVKFNDFLCWPYYLSGTILYPPP